MNWNVVGSIYGRFSIHMHISSRSVNKHGRHRQFLFLIGPFLRNKSSPLKPLVQMNQNLVARKHLWKVRYKVFPKQNERWEIQAHPTEPLVDNSPYCCVLSREVTNTSLKIFCLHVRELNPRSSPSGATCLSADLFQWASSIKIHP
jgi:hypothetical protein